MEKKAITKKCALGLDCAGMMMQPGIDPGECENYRACREAKGLNPNDEFELVQRRPISTIYIPQLTEEERQQRAEERRIRQEEYERHIITTTRGILAKEMLMRRGSPQTVESLGVLELYNEMMDLAMQLSEHFNTFNNEYVAPPGVEAHYYNVKRPKGTFGYNKLTAKENIFEPADEPQKVKVIHLSHDDDPRNIIARHGIQRRNKLLETKTRLREIAKLLRECME